MKYSVFAEVENYVKKEGMIEGVSSKEEVLITFPDLCKTDAYYPDPLDPFNSTVIIMGALKITLPLTKYQFEKLHDASRQYNLFSKITLN